MTLTLQNIRDGILRATGTELTDWANGNTDLDQYANISWWDVMDKFDFREKEAAPTTLVTVAGTRSYSMTTVLANFDALQRVSITDPNDDSHTDLDMISEFNYENLYDETSDAQAKPTNYFRRGSLIYLYPTPDAVYTLNFYCLQTLSDLPNSGPVIPQSWHEIIKSGAIWRAFADLGDEVKTMFWKNLQDEIISGRTPVKAKELSDTKLAGIEIPGRDYP